MPAETVLTFGLLLATLFYSATIFALILGMIKVRQTRSESKPFVSIIVAARNEESNLVRLIPALNRQVYPSFEIIIANDRSNDATAQILEDFQRRTPNLKVVNISEITSGLPPKKNALAEAIKVSKGELLCFTDADCLPGERWISELVSCFSPEVGLVVGYSPYVESLDSGNTRKTLFKKILEKFVAYEELKAAAWSAGSIGLGKGWLCTGRNLAYRREVYDKVGGYEQIRHSVSGDDDLFLQLVRRQTQWKIRYSTSPFTFVPTTPPPSFGIFVEQRKRHFSAAKFFPFSMKLFFFLFHLANFTLFAAFFATFFLGPSFLVGIPCFAIKLCADATLFLIAITIFQQRGFGRYFLLMEILYIFYNTFIGPLGLWKKFEWKPDVKA